jgi:hypothetical protein
MSSEFGRFLNSDKHTHFGKFSMINKLDSAVSRKVFSMLLPLNNLVILRHRNWQVWNRSEFTVIKPQSIWANDDIYIIYIYVYVYVLCHRNPNITGTKYTIPYENG